MRWYEDSVREFHCKHGFAMDKKLEDEPGTIDTDSVLLGLHDAMIGLSRITQRQGTLDLADGDSRLWNAHLLLEELAEIIKALAIKDEVELADGLADLWYVLQGSALAYSIPLPHVFAEVCRSNMTKAVRNVDADPRMRSKGDEYKPPDIAGAIRDGRMR